MILEPISPHMFKQLPELPRFPQRHQGRSQDPDDDHGKHPAFTPKAHTPGKQVQVQSQLLQGGGQPKQTRKEGARLLRTKTQDIPTDQGKATGSVPAPSAPTSSSFPDWLLTTLNSTRRVNACPEAIGWKPTFQVASSSLLHN